MLRRGEKQRRHPKQPTPCDKCPKVSPAHEKEKTLSAKNRKTLGLYFAARTAGLSEAEKTDAIVRRNFAILEQVFSVWDKRQAAEELGAMMALMRTTT